MSTYTCEMCGRTFEKTRTDEEAIAEAEARFGREVANDPHVVCGDCFAWMLDVERIARSMLVDASLNPDEIVSTDDGPMPMWMTLIGDAKQQTKLPSPQELAGQS